MSERKKADFYKKCNDLRRQSVRRESSIYS
jgi:hypothetical protein